MSDSYVQLTGPAVDALVCERCGALVTNTEIHNAFHGSDDLALAKRITDALDRVPRFGAR